MCTPIDRRTISQRILSVLQAIRIEAGGTNIHAAEQTALLTRIATALERNAPAAPEAPRAVGEFTSLPRYVNMYRSRMSGMVVTGTQLFVSHEEAVRDGRITGAANIGPYIGTSKVLVDLPPNRG